VGRLVVGDDRIEVVAGIHDEARLRKAESR
jgi:hypothetical protein